MLKKRESIVKNFETFLEESNMEPLATLITNLQDLEADIFGINTTSLSTVLQCTFFRLHALRKSFH